VAARKPAQWRSLVAEVPPGTLAKRLVSAQYHNRLLRTQLADVHGRLLAAEARATAAKTEIMALEHALAEAREVGRNAVKVVAAVRRAHATFPNRPIRPWRAKLRRWFKW
jgi:hypothetical protein